MRLDFLFLFTVQGEGEGGRGWFFFPYRYGPGIMGIMPVVGGCLTRKKTQRCLAV